METPEIIRQAQNAQARHIPVIDVRTPEEFKQGHLPGAINIPMSRILHTQIPDGSYVYCKSGARAGMAAAELKKRGINVINIGGVQSVNPHWLVR